MQHTTGIEPVVSITDSDGQQPFRILPLKTTNRCSLLTPSFRC